MSIGPDQDLFKPPKHVRDRRATARDLAVFVAFECGFGSRQIAEFTGIRQSYEAGIARRFARKLRSQTVCQEALRRVERELKCGAFPSANQCRRYPKTRKAGRSARGSRPVPA